MSNRSIYLDKQKQRRGVSLCAALLANPASMTTQLPASGIFAVSSVVDRAAGEVFTVAGTPNRTVSAPDIVAGAMFNVGFLESGSTITMAAGADLYLDTGLGVYRKIITGA